MTSLVGHSGSGKSTIMHLIPRFYDRISGDITIDDQSIYDVSIKTLRNEISLVSQETTLFDDTIMNNINRTSSTINNVHDHVLEPATRKFSQYPPTRTSLGRFLKWLRRVPGACIHSRWWGQRLH